MAKKASAEEPQITKEEMSALSEAYEAAEQPSASGERKVRDYDFASPDKVGKEYLRTLRALHSDFATGLGVLLSSICQTQTQVSVSGLNQLSYKEYRSSLPPRTLLAELSVEPLSRYMIFEINPGIVGLWVDVLCGGVPQSAAEPSTLTELDIAVADKVLTSLLESYAEAWSSVVRIKPEVRQMSASDDHDETLVPSEAVLVCSFDVSTEKPVGGMTICVPATSFEAVLPMLSTYGLGRSAAKSADKASTEEMARLLHSVSLTCAVELGSAKISLTDAMNLKAGDVIKTDRSVDSELEMRIGGIPLYLCRPGVRGRNVSVMVAEAIPQSEGPAQITPLPVDELSEAPQDLTPETEVPLAA